MEWLRLRTKAAVVNGVGEKARKDMFVKTDIVQACPSLGRGRYQHSNRKNPSTLQKPSSRHWPQILGTDKAEARLHWTQSEIRGHVALHSTVADAVPVPNFRPGAGI